MKQIKRPKSKETAIVLAVLLSYWTWIYTWNEDWQKWIIALLFPPVAFILNKSIYIFYLISLGVWIWAIIDRAVKPREQYQNYTVQF